ncbi:hypothetical protein [Chlorogloea sp. CCALA 695]|uniref:hypothetical protein n=1 Tax=Chlorogloea sp. CCALA 695 TaxID=2107693 RepID=UPI0011B22517|nr:hypothetical protein [Chlorogloea sp. CCALA 695]
MLRKPALFTAALAVIVVNKINNPTKNCFEVEVLILGMIEPARNNAKGKCKKLMSGGAPIAVKIRGKKTTAINIIVRLEILIIFWQILLHHLSVVLELNNSTIYNYQ